MDVLLRELAGRGHGADLDVAALWAAGVEVAPRSAVMSTAVTVDSLVPEDKDSAEDALQAALAIRCATDLAGP